MFFENLSYLNLKSHVNGVFETPEGNVAYFVDKRLVFERVIICSCPEAISETSLKSFFQYVERKYPSVMVVAKPHANIFITTSPENISDYNVVTCPWGTYLKALDLNDRDLLYSFKGNTRRDVQKAIENGLTVRDVSWAECHKLLKDMFTRHGQPGFIPSKSLIKGLSEQFPDNVLLLGVYNGQALQSVALIPFDEVRGYYLYGASVARPERGSMHLLQYEIMKKLRDRGVSHYDFYGARIGYDKKSKVAGIQRFKESFKPELQQGYCFKVILRPFLYQLFEAFVKVFYFLKKAKYEGDPIDQFKKQK